MGIGPSFNTVLTIPAALIAVFAVGCGPTASETPMINTLVADTAGIDTKAPPVEMGHSAYGHYLAGRHALKKRDFSAASDMLGQALTEDPEDEQLLRRTLLARLALGKVGEAVGMARKVIENDEIAPIARLALVVDAVHRGDFKAAAAEIEAFPDRGYSGFMRPLLDAWVKVGQKQGDKALEALEPLQNQSGLQTLYELHAGLIADVVGKPEVAAAHYERADEASRRQTLRIVQALGRHYEMTGQGAKAKELYERYLEQNPDSVVLEPALARIEAGKKPGPLAGTAAEGIAEALFNIAGTMTRESSSQLALIYGRLAIYLKPDFDLAQVLVANILESMERFEDAIALYKQIETASPLFASTQLRIAANLEELKRDAEAIDLLQELSRKYPARADLLVTLGDIYRSNKKYLESVGAYDKAVKAIGDLDRRHWTLLYSRGISLERSNQWPRAEKDFRQALSLNPEQPYVLNYLGYSWVDQGINLDEARKMIERAVELRPDDGYIVDSLGWVLYRLKDFEGAVEHLERAVELRPQDPTINDHLGDALWRVGRKHEARFQWKRALSLGPDAENVPEIERKIEKGMRSANAGERDS